MFNVKSEKHLIPLIFGFALLLEFVVNVVFGIRTDDRQLQVDNWTRQQQVSSVSSDGFKVNAVFGLKPEVDTEAEKLRLQREQEAADKLAQEKARKKAEEELKIGEENIRLYGISVVNNERVAMLSISHSGGSGELFQLKEGESIELQNGRNSVGIEKVLTDSVTLSVTDNKKSTKSSINLVIFSYGI